MPTPDRQLAPPIESVYALSPVQEGMLFASLASPEHKIYLEQGTCEIEGMLDPHAFSCAWNNTAQRHGALRTGFYLRNLRKPAQVVLKQVPLAVDCIDLRSSDDAQRDWLRIVEQDRDRGFDLTQPPLCRITLARTGDEVYRLLWTMHHLIHDAWSSEILMREVLGYIEGRSTSTTSPAGSYRDFVSWIRNRDWSGGRAYWRAALGKNARATRLPGRYGSGPSPRYAERRLSPEVSAGLEAAARTNGVTLNTLAHAAVAVALCRHERSQEALFGTVVSGRTSYSRNANSLVGVLINTLPIRIELTDTITTRRWLEQIQKTIQASLQWEHMPAGLICESLQVAPGESIFDVVLVFQNAFQHLDYHSATRLRIRNIRSFGFSNLPLTIRISPLTSGWWLEALAGADNTASYTEPVLNGVCEVLKHLSKGDYSGTLPTVFASPEKAMKASHSQRVSFTSVKPRPVQVSETDLVALEEMEQPLPLVIHARQSSLRADNWLQHKQELIAPELLSRGGVLFRGFAIREAEDFRMAADSLSFVRMEYKERSTPRTSVGDRIYTSTEYPAHQHIAWHNEFSYAYTWPLKILFCCLIAPEQGGETPIVDSRTVYRDMHPDVRRRFETGGVLYVRNYGQGIDLTWQEAFQTNSKHDVEEHCRRAPLEWEWLPGDRLRTRQLRPATGVHPSTGETVWFNQAHLFHVSNLGPEGEASMRAAFREEDLPRNAYYGDGSSIPAADLDEVRRAYRSAEIRFSWQPGDLLILDNMLVAHGRNPYRGERRVLTAMLEPYTREAM